MGRAGVGLRKLETAMLTGGWVLLRLRRLHLCARHVRADCSFLGFALKLADRLARFECRPREQEGQAVFAMSTTAGDSD